ncbi:hypothetical protein MNBD_CHLOROFLEXI01-3341 [hydrothermal vent metagenome]|uniref:Bacterial transcriptional activator domain-containing protein n=1 Tax=hydrothermal vent metagenome TaxID=652676 RepID=A0A3B0VNV5_9ZZZZ
MEKLHVLLFGKLSIASTDTNRPTVINNYKVQELLCFLLLNQRKPFSREYLATLLWPENGSFQAKKYLRKTLWQFQTGLQKLGFPDGQTILNIDAEWCQINQSGPLWCDVTAFEQAFAITRDTLDSQLTPEKAQQLQEAVNLYQGDLLEGWYQDWCLLERERLQRIYLLILDKLINYCARHERYELGVFYGQKSLRCDPARERTHRRLMKMHYLCSNRTEAVRQFRQCRQILQQELNVQPTERTHLLLEHIKTDRLPKPLPRKSQWQSSEKLPSNSFAELPDILQRLEHASQQLATIQNQMKQDIEAVKQHWRHSKINGTVEETVEETVGETAVLYTVPITQQKPKI